MKDKILQLIKEHNRIILLCHIIPDGDAYGVQLGLKEIIKTNWPNKIVLAAGTNSDYLNFIGTMDTVHDDDFKDSLVIIGDCGNLARVDDDRYKLAKTIIKIDHHPNVEPYGDIIWVDEQFGSASEMIALWVKECNLKVSSLAARIIYHGMVTDSGRFLYSRTNARTFSLASFLLIKGFDLDQLYREMYQVSEEDLKFMSFVYENYQTSTKGVLYLVFDNKTLKKLGINHNTVASKVNLLANVKNKPIWVFFCEDENHNIRVELRSNKFFVNTVASKYNGGGHNFAAGARINDFNDVKNIISDLDEVISRGEPK
ncbi:bifunctional oligoribonuclease/PAP phosphatase NrnA [Spiroplasma endosymbiont of Dilophus febrilis]|uniref:DHH family phosphoesterase n=1 Tax=Spiroplasma endosymbiont of Dilophus febrilis TaxID=3066292 RepID=UPI00313A8AC0